MSHYETPPENAEIYHMGGALSLEGAPLGLSEQMTAGPAFMSGETNVPHGRLEVGNNEGRSIGRRYEMAVGEIARSHHPNP